MQGFGGRGWGFEAQIIKNLRKRMKIKEVLEMFLDMGKTDPPTKGYHLPGMYRRGRKIKRVPDYYEGNLHD